METNSIDYAWIDGSDGEFNWALDGLGDLPPPSGTHLSNMVKMNGACEDACCSEQMDSRKRSRNDRCVGSKSKACREKMRRDRLNDRFTELSAVLEPGKPPKSDKAGILVDAARTLAQLRSETEELKEANRKLKDTIKDLKEEKNELRDEKLKLKADKDRLDQQLKLMSLPPGGFMPHAAAYHAAAAFYSQSQDPKNKSAAFPTFPTLPTWQWFPPGRWLPPAARDIAQDQKHVSPTA